jgi:hypothetical protein
VPAAEAARLLVARRRPPVIEAVLVQILLFQTSQPTRPDAAPAETLIKLTVDSMPAPRPALKYLLLPDLQEMSQGNPIPGYLKALLDQDFSSPQEGLGKEALRQVDRAARMDKPDWQLLPKLRTDGIGLLLPDLQQMRQLAAALQGRFRDEIARRRFGDAIYTARTTLALARHTGEHPTLIGGLVGIAIAFVALGPLEEMLEQPGCPNLYWALTNLPTPFITMEKAMEGERLLTVAELGDIDERRPMTAAQLRKVMQRLELFSDGGRKRVKEWLAERAKDEKYMEAARRRLADSGVPAERLAQFSTYQVILLDEKLEYEVQRDEVTKFVNLPTWEAVPRLANYKVPDDRLIAHLLLPTYHKVRVSQGRLEQKVALLRCVEALRMHAAAHGGKLPPKLADVEVPLPADPFTGRPFRYELKSGTAHLRGAAPKGYADQAAFNLHYEITIRK